MIKLASSSDNRVKTTTRIAIILDMIISIHFS